MITPATRPSPAPALRAVRAGPLLAALGLAPWPLACQDPGAGAPVPVEPAPVLPSVTSPVPEPSDTPAWLEQLSEPTTRVATGDRVWATVRTVGPLARVGVFVVDSVADGRVSLTDALGQRTDVHAALVHPAPAPVRLRMGDCVLFTSSTTEARLGRVAAVKAGEDILVAHDAAGTTREVAVDHAEPAREGVAPLAFVDVPKGASRTRALVVALQGDRVFVRVESGHVEVHPLDAVRPLPLPAPALEAGQRVRAFRWATGFVTGTVRQVREPGLRYEVALDGNRPAAPYFFTQVLPTEG